jgi:hypothetical protein
MTVLITLTTAGSSTGPFSLYSNVDSYSTPFVTGVSRSSLLAGYTSTVVPNGTTIVRVMSTGTCTNYTDISVVPCTTTTTTSTSTSTSTTTTTTTVPPTTTTTTTSSSPVMYTINSGASGTSGEACGQSPTISVWAQPGFTVPFVTMILYTIQSPLSNPFIGSTGWRKLIGPSGTYAVEIDVNGEITNYVTCP